MAPLDRSKHMDRPNARRLRQPEPQDWQRWQPEIMARYKMCPVRLFIKEMDAEGLKVTEKMLRDRFRQWGINDKNRKSSIAKSQGPELSARHHKNALPRYQCLISLSPQQPPKTPGRDRLLQHALRGIHDWQLHFRDSQGERQAVISATIWLRTCLRSMRWAVHCLDNQPSLDQSDLAFKRLREASTRLRNNFHAKCSPPAVLMSMFTLLKFSSLDDRSSSIYYSTARRFFFQVAAETLPVAHPTRLLLQVFLYRQTPDTIASIFRVGLDTIGQCLGATSQEVWASQIDLTDSVTKSHSSAKSEATLSENEFTQETLSAENISTGKDSTNLELAHVHRLHSLSTLKTRKDKSPRKAYGAYQLLAASQHWLNDSAGEEASLHNALRLAKTMEVDVADQSGGLSFEMLQAIRELYCFYENGGKIEGCEALRLEYPRPFREWDNET